MVQTRTPTDTIALTDAEQRFAQVVARVTETQTRMIVEEDGIPIAAVISTKELDRLDRFDAEWDAGWEVLDEIGAAFRDVDPDEIERETAWALAEVRAEMQAERAAKERR